MTSPDSPTTYHATIVSCHISLVASQLEAENFLELV